MRGHRRQVRTTARRKQSGVPRPQTSAARSSTGAGAASRSRVDAVRVVSAALDDRLGMVMARLREARVRPTEPAIHDLRVGMRRLIAVVDLARVVVPDAGIPSLRRRLRKDLKRFNAVRDIHISLLAMTSMVRSLPQVRPYIQVLRVRERALLRECAASLRSIDERSIERSVATVQQSLFAVAADPALERSVAPMMHGAMARTYVNAVRALRNVHAADPSTIHRLRIAFKKVRYASEVLALLTGGMNKATRKWMGEYQTLMGEVQDHEVMIAGARRFALTPVAGRRIPMIAVQGELARRKRERLAAFLERAGELETRYPSA